MWSIQLNHISLKRGQKRCQRVTKNDEKTIEFLKAFTPIRKMK